jgi:hypothetical protein
MTMRIWRWIGCLVLILAIVGGSAALAGKGGGKGKPGGGGGSAGPLLVFEAPSNSVSYLWTQDPDSGSPVQFATGGYDYAKWSRDGTRILARARSGGPGTVFIFDYPAGAIRHQYAHGGREFSWSKHLDTGGAVLPADQQLLGYALSVPDGQRKPSRNLFVMKPDGSGSIQLTHHEFDSTIRTNLWPNGWLPDDADGNARIAYRREEDEFKDLDGDGTYEIKNYGIFADVRLLTLDTSNWPQVAVLADELIARPDPGDVADQPWYLIWDWRDPDLRTTS